MGELIRRRGLKEPNGGTPSYNPQWLRGYEYNSSGALNSASNGNYFLPMTVSDGDILNISVIARSGIYTRGVQFDGLGNFINAKQYGAGNAWNQNIVGWSGHKIAISYIKPTRAESDCVITYIGNTSDLRPSTERPAGYESIIFGQDSYTLNLVRTYTANNLNYAEVEIRNLPSSTVIAPVGLTKDTRTYAVNYLSPILWSAGRYSNYNYLDLQIPTGIIGGNDLSAIQTYFQSHRFEFYVQS